MDGKSNKQGLSLFDKFIKRSFDLVFSLLGLIFFSWLIILAFVIASIETKSNGFFIQKRVGKDGKIFNVIKIKTMKPVKGLNSTVTTSNDLRITKSGKFFRKTKIDELPQLINVLLGQMSFVGPRPDVPGYADKLVGEDRIILSVRPGITGPATIKYRNEEELLARVEDPEKYNKEVIYPDKVRINKEYVQNYSFWKDIMYIIKTIF
ncbi:sugar transferase [Geobacillus stearothermophilus]|uniref:sugar transferase n=1 Tax=Geobacillus stearothermophilus TaxID=1422 RepID=UPI002E1A2A42|nr:sugar transferase [Geobacillus stearothermophilus]